jgi:anti-anti-sigma factor
MDETVSMHGRITIDNSDEMRQTLAAALKSRKDKLTVDLSSVTYMDTSGLATLMESLRVARRQGTQLVLCGVQEQPLYLLEVTDLTHVFEIEECK